MEIKEIIRIEMEQIFKNSIWKKIKNFFLYIISIIFIAFGIITAFKALFIIFLGLVFYGLGMLIGAAVTIYVGLKIYPEISEEVKHE